MIADQKSFRTKWNSKEKAPAKRMMGKNAASSSSGSMRCTHRLAVSLQ